MHTGTSKGDKLSVSGVIMIRIQEYKASWQALMPAHKRVVDDQVKKTELDSPVLMIIPFYATVEIGSYLGLALIVVIS